MVAEMFAGPHERRVVVKVLAAMHTPQARVARYGRDSTAQGEALGPQSDPCRSPKGRHSRRD